MSVYRVAVPAAALPTMRAGRHPAAELVAVPAPGEDGVVERLGDIKALVLDHDRRDLLPLLARIPTLEAVGVLVVGTEWVAPSLPAGVELFRPTGARDVPVAEWVASALLGAASGLLEAVREQDACSWTRRASTELAGQRVVVAGQGSTGRAATRMLQHLGVDVLPVASRARRDVDGDVHGVEDLHDLVSEAEALVLLVPGTSATHRLVDAALLARMPAGALLVNASRGSVVDTEALVDQLRAGRLRAVLDVTDPEPLPPAHPLWRLPGCAISPHVAGATVQARRRAWAQVAAWIDARAGRRSRDPSRAGAP